MTSDHRVAGSSPAGCKLLEENERDEKLVKEMALKADFACTALAFLRERGDGDSKSPTKQGRKTKPEGCAGI